MNFIHRCLVTLTFPNQHALCAYIYTASIKEISAKVDLNHLSLDNSPDNNYNTIKSSFSIAKSLSLIFIGLI